MKTIEKLAQEIEDVIKYYQECGQGYPSSKSLAREILADYDLIPKGKVIMLDKDAEPQEYDIGVDKDGDVYGWFYSSNEEFGWYDINDNSYDQRDTPITIIKRGNSLVIMREKQKDFYTELHEIAIKEDWLNLKDTK